MQLAGRALTFDDVALVPAYSEVTARDAVVTSRFSRRITLNIPIAAAAMDTVTRARMAIAIAQEGGIGIIHKNLSPQQQAAEVAKVKRYESGMLRDPVTIAPEQSVGTVQALARERGISGFPVIENGKVVGVVTNRDLRFEERLDASVRSIMTPRARLITVREGASLQEAKALMHRHRIERVIILNDRDELRGLYTVTDITKQTSFPNAARDASGRLRVGAAISVGEESEVRAQLLADAGVDVLVVDTAHGHSKNVLARVAWVKRSFPQLDVVGGNVATAEGARALMEAGADGVKVGIGPGSICTTRIVAGVGVPQITAIAEAASALAGSGVSLIADGGIRYSGDLAKAITAGADCIMVGSLLAGTEEAPGEVVLYQGRSYKNYRGMGSIGAMQAGSADRYFQEAIGKEGAQAQSSEKFVPEGIEGRVPFKGPVAPVLFQLIGGLRSAMGYCGCKTIAEMQTRPRLVEVTAAGVRESHVHDVQITKEAPNYRVE